MAVTEMQLLEGIADCMIGEPTPEKMIKLAAFYAVKDRLFGEKPIQASTYSTSPPPQEQTERISASGNTDFLKAVDGRDTGSVMDIMDELMETMKVIQPKIYASVMRRVSEIK